MLLQKLMNPTFETTSKTNFFKKLKNVRKRNQKQIAVKPKHYCDNKNDTKWVLKIVRYLFIVFNFLAALSIFNFLSISNISFRQKNKVICRYYFS